ncbi:hypothetical protein M2333_001219 [Sphingobium sp. B11D3B]|uniref:hypothetical protein n=1 Tax=Sphingobium sp. B11D3B TaxID=2940575 RepID=UPI0022274EDA|nr:hypothetical protein [Sphingobium sp. B11D3B]MCW2388173.1 hypothetical protein [Sphingobium sp. B11D3B]
MASPDTPPAWQGRGLPGAMMRRLLSLLLLALIAVQAWPDGAATFQPRNGSAFSASTVDVALVPPGRSEFAKTGLPHTLPPLPYAPDVVAAGRTVAVPEFLPRLGRADPTHDQAARRNRGPRPPPSV